MSEISLEDAAAAAAAAEQEAKRAAADRTASNAAYDLACARAVHAEKIEYWIVRNAARDRGEEEDP